ncbi:MAG: DUF1801 domain-containing protein [Sediminibacterium sp.]|nr:DUF1801 domain-containing protein [Sediminibacterium sp.]
MKTGKAVPVTVDEYIAMFPKVVQERLIMMRQIIKKEAPEAEEKISYGMPAYHLNGPLVYFAGYAKHIGFYATPSGHEKFKKALSVYKQGKGSVQFPLEEALPVKLVEDIVKFRIKENATKIKLGLKKKTR